MAERLRIDEVRFAQAVQLVAATLTRDPLQIEESDTLPNVDVVRVAVREAYFALADAHSEIESRLQELGDDE